MGAASGDPRFEAGRGAAVLGLYRGRGLHGAIKSEPGRERSRSVETGGGGGNVKLGERVYDVASAGG